MISFSSHPAFDKEMRNFLKKHHQDDGWLDKLKNLLASHFDAKKVNLGTEVLAPVGEFQDYRLYKTYMAVGGVSKNDRPRVCFARNEKSIIFLCFGTHINNYNTRELVAMGIRRIKEFVGV